MEANVAIDETSCGPFCQHPYCWYSNRRMERGLPQTREVSDNTAGSTDGELPTLKVMNILDEYGYDPRDHYPTRQLLPRKSSHDAAAHPVRSLSAPTAREGDEQSQTLINIVPQKVPPPTPRHTPTNSRHGPKTGGAPSPQGAGHRSAPSSPSHHAYQTLGQRVNRVDLKEALDFGGVKHQGVMPSGKMYVWCPPKDDKSKATQDSKPSEAQTRVRPKDVTADMFPESMASQHKSSKTKKKQPNHQTPTGGRPYTHPARSPPPSTRRTLPQDLDAGIAQLLRLPRDLLLEILEHTKESDLFDKEKVALLLEKLMPLIHFHKDEMPPARPISPINMQLSTNPPSAPLHSSGILRQKKVTLLDNTQKRAESVRAPPPSRSMPFFMDESAMSGITSSTYTRRERPVNTRDEDRDTTLPSPTIASEDIIKRKPLGPLRGGPTEMSQYSRRKVTSVSAKSLPPLQPGSKVTRPFNYTAQSFDLALSPLSTQDYEASEKPSSPYSGRASTVYVTVPSVLSDHTPPATPASIERTPVPPITRQSSAHLSNTSSAASEDFPELHWVDMENAMQGGAPHAPTHVSFRMPYGTETVVKGGSSHREDLTQSSSRYYRQGHRDVPPSTAYDSPSATPSMPPASYTCPPTADLDQERPINTATTDTRGVSDSATPMRRPDSTSHYDAATSVMAQASDKAAGSPMPLVTPLPSTTSPEVWPDVDERDYMQSPERKIDRLSNKPIEMIQAPVAPPPSPEPVVMDVEYDINDMANKSTSGSSLTPLAEEEEEEEGEDHPPGAGEMDLERESTRETEKNRTGTRSRGYLADDEDAGSHPTTADSDAGKPLEDGSPLDGDLPAVQEENDEAEETIVDEAEGTVVEETEGPVVEDAEKLESEDQGDGDESTVDSRKTYDKVDPVDTKDAENLSNTELHNKRADESNE